MCPLLKSYQFFYAYHDSSALLTCPILDYPLVQWSVISHVNPHMKVAVWITNDKKLHITRAKGKIFWEHFANGNLNNFCLSHCTVGLGCCVPEKGPGHPLICLCTTPFVAWCSSEKHNFDPCLVSNMGLKIHRLVSSTNEHSQTSKIIHFITFVSYKRWNAKGRKLGKRENWLRKRDRLFSRPKYLSDVFHI